MRALLVEDDDTIAGFVERGLREAGFAVDRFGDGESGLLAALGQPYDVAIVDTMLPKRDGVSIDLRPREFALLEYLMRNAGKVISKTMILSHVWDYSFDPQTNIVDVLVSRLREKIDRRFEKKLLHTVRGVGYVIRG